MLCVARASQDLWALFRSFVIAIAIVGFAFDFQSLMDAYVTHNYETDFFQYACMHNIRQKRASKFLFQPRSERLINLSRAARLCFDGGTKNCVFRKKYTKIMQLYHVSCAKWKENPVLTRLETLCEWDQIIHNADSMNDRLWLGIPLLWWLNRLSGTTFSRCSFIFIMSSQWNPQQSSDS